jgi:hypothetical protein
LSFITALCAARQALSLHTSHKSESWHQWGMGDNILCSVAPEALNEGSGTANRLSKHCKFKMFDVFLHGFAVYQECTAFTSKVIISNAAVPVFMDA